MGWMTLNGEEIEYKVLFIDGGELRPEAYRFVTADYTNARIARIGKEFEALRDVDIENALKEYPAEFWESGISDFERDMIGALEIPPISVKKLRGYLYRAAKDGARLRSDATLR